MVAIVNGDLPSAEQKDEQTVNSYTNEGVFQRPKSKNDSHHITCEICKMSFISADFLKFHAKVHLPIKFPLETSQCWKQATEKHLEFIINHGLTQFEFIIQNQCSENVKLSSIILINELLDHAYLNSQILPITLEPNQQMSFLMEHHYFYIKNRNSLTVIYENDKNIEFMQRYGFFVKENASKLMGQLITVEDRISGQMDDIPELVLFKLKGYEPSPAIKSLVRENFKVTASQTRRELELLEKILDFTPEQLSPSNYVQIQSIMIEIEDYTTQWQMNRYDQFSKLNRITSKLYKLPFPSDPPFLMECDNVLLMPIDRNQNNRRHKPIYGFVRQFTGQSMIIKTTKTLDPDVYCYRIHFIANRLPFRFEQQSLHLAGELKIIDFLFPVKPSMPKSVVNQAELELFEKDISENPEQYQAVKNILYGTSYPSPYIIFGPPGTGKTKTVVESICQILKTNSNSHILICALSNGTCDEIAARILHYLDQFDKNAAPKILRLYAPTARKETAHIDVINMSNYNQKKYPDLNTIYKYRVIISTLAVAGRLTQAKIKTNHFTHLFIDECECATETVALIPIAGVCSSMKKINAQIVLAGDPKQLGPVLKSDTTREKGRSMLERLMNLPMYQRDLETGKYNGNVITKLVQNYRSHPAIFKFSNENFYDNEIVPFGNKGKTHWATNLSLLPSPDFPIIFESVNGQTKRIENCPSCYNDCEIELVVFYIKQLLNSKELKIKQSDIGVVSPYKRQYWMLEKEFVKYRWFDIQAGSVETFQGQEKPIIIVTTTKSEKSVLGFLQDEKRLNVLLTRAESLLIVIGNADALCKDENWKNFINYVKENNGFKVNLESNMAALKLNGQPMEKVL